VGREVVDACDLAVGKILNAMVFQTLCGVMHEPARQDLVFFEDFATETWMHKLLAGAVLIETGKEVQRDWAACAHTLAVEDCAADGLLASLAEFGSVAPGDAKVLMAEKVAVELSLVAAEEVQDVHDARAELAKAEHHMQVSEASHDVDGYLEAAASYDRAQAQVQREEAEAAAAVEARETAEAAVATAKAEQLVEIEVEEAAEALQLAQLADERLEKALAAGDLQGITAAHGIAEAARLRADKEELEAIEAASARKVAVVGSEVAAVRALAEKQAAHASLAANIADLAEGKLKAALVGGDMDAIAAAARVAEDARVASLKAKAEASSTGSKLQMAKVRLSAAQAGAAAERERFAARAKDAAAQRAHIKVSMVSMLGPHTESLHAADLHAQEAWNQIEPHPQPRMPDEGEGNATFDADAEVAGVMACFDAGVIGFVRDDIFGKLDLDGNETISQSELANLLKKLLASSGRVADNAEVEAQAEEAIQRYDVDDSGALDFGEFMALITQEPWALCLPGRLQGGLAAASARARQMAEASRQTRLQGTHGISCANNENDLRIESVATTQASPELLQEATPGQPHVTPVPVFAEHAAGNF